MRKQPHPPSWAMNLRTSSRELSGYSIANEVGVAAVEASALPASLVPLNLVGLRTKLFMEFNLGRNSAPVLSLSCCCCKLTWTFVATLSN